jgi:hypothetical protein
MTKININKLDYEEMEEQQRSKSRSKKKIRKMRSKEEK